MIHVYRSKLLDIAMSNPTNGTYENVFGKNGQSVANWVAQHDRTLIEDQEITEVVGEVAQVDDRIELTDGSAFEEKVAPEESALRLEEQLVIQEYRAAYPRSYWDTLEGGGREFVIVVNNRDESPDWENLPFNCRVEVFDHKHIDGEWVIMNIFRDKHGVLRYKHLRGKAKDGPVDIVAIVDDMRARNVTPSKANIEEAVWAARKVDTERVVPASAVIREPNKLTGDGLAYAWFLRRKKNVGDGDPYNRRPKGDRNEGLLNQLAAVEQSLIRNLSGIFTTAKKKDQLINELWNGKVPEGEVPLLGTKGATAMINIIKRFAEQIADVRDDDEDWEQKQFSYTSKAGEEIPVRYSVSRSALDVVEEMNQKAWSNFVTPGQLISQMKDPDARNKAWATFGEFIEELVAQKGFMNGDASSLFRDMERIILKKVDEIPFVTRKLNTDADGNSKFIDWNYRGFATKGGMSDYCEKVIIPAVAKVINDCVKFKDGRAALSPGRDGKFYLGGDLGSYVMKLAWAAYSSQQWYASSLVRNPFWAMTLARFVDAYVRVLRSEDAEYAYVTASVMADKTHPDYRGGFSERREAMEALD